MRKNNALSKGLMVAGILLLAAAAGLAFFRAWAHTRQAEALSQAAVQMQTLLSEPSAGIPGERPGEEMPRLEIGGRDYIGMLELPGKGIALPVAADWNTGRCPFRPARYSGTIYDGTLVIGGNYSEDCFAFISRLDAGDRVDFTDVQGVRYSFTVWKITHRTAVDTDALDDEEAPCVLFTEKDNLYLIVHCIPL